MDAKYKGFTVKYLLFAAGIAFTTSHSAFI